MNLVKTPSNYAGKAAVSIPDSGEFGQQCQAANSMVEVLDRVIASVCESGGAELKDFLATKMNIPSLEGEGFGDTAQAGYSSASGRLSFRVRTHACPTRLAICARTPRSPRSAFLLAFRCFGPKPHASGLPDARAASPSPEGEGFTDPRWETLNYRDRPTHRPPSQMREGMHRYRSRAIPGTSRGRSSRGS